MKPFLTPLEPTLAHDLRDVVGKEFGGVIERDADAIVMTIYAAQRDLDFVIIVNDELREIIAREFLRCPEILPSRKRADAIASAVVSAIQRQTGAMREVIK